MELDRIRERVERLITMGETVLGTRSAPPSGDGIVFLTDDFVDSGTFHQWRASCLSFLGSVFGETHTHSRLFDKDVTVARHEDAVKGHGIIKAAREDIRGGYLTSLADLAAADVFTDFLDMAEHLLECSYKDPAASLIGAVLEDGLKRIARHSDIEVKERDDIQALNGRLGAKQVYPRLVQQQVQVWNSVRNSADHGNFSEYDADRVKAMLLDVRSFLAKHLT